MANSIQCTVDEGRLHVSYDGLYSGSIDSYNNWFTKLFAWVFGWSISININGKSRSVNKTDYANWLNNHTSVIGASKAVVKEFADFCLLQIKPPQDNAAPTNRCLSSYKTASLYRKLVHCMYANNFDGAKKYTIKGAALGPSFWIRGEYGISFNARNAGFATRQMELTIREYTPLLFAADHRQNQLCELMRRCGANIEAVGQEIGFSRSIIDHQHTVSTETSIGYIRNRPPVYHHPHYGRRPVITPVLHVDQHHATVLKLQDRETKRFDIVFDSFNNSTRHYAVQNPTTIVTNFDAPISSYTQRII